MKILNKKLIKKISEKCNNRGLFVLGLAIESTQQNLVPNTLFTSLLSALSSRHKIIHILVFIPYIEILQYRLV